jgi:hypothetical protein
MSDTPNCFIKKSPAERPEILGQGLQKHRARPSLGQEKGFYHNELDDRAAVVHESTTDRDWQLEGHLLWVSSTFYSTIEDEPE